MMVMTDRDDTEVTRARRSWPAQYKLDILNEIDEAKRTGTTTVAEICRREGLYSSLITQWRQQRDQGALEGLTDRKAGRPPKDRTRAELARLRERVALLEAELGTANELIDAQGKVSALWQAKSRPSAEKSTPKRSPN